MATRRKKHRCAEPGCPTMLAAKQGEYCSEHTCAAFSASYGQRVLTKNHQNKHLSEEGEEW